MNPHATNGIVVGIVCDLEDPESLGRVRVTYPHLADARSDWMRTVNAMAGGGRGTFFRPEVGDEVLVGWEHNDSRRPYLLGAVWSKKDKPPADDGDAKHNNWRFITSRSGHVLKLDDTDGAERIEVYDSSGSCRIVLDSAAQKVQILCDGDIEIASSGGDVSISGTNVSVSANQKLDLSGSAGASLKGATVDIN